MMTGLNHLDATGHCSNAKVALAFVMGALPMCTAVDTRAQLLEEDL